MIPVVADTCVWADHFRTPSPLLVSLIGARHVATHSVIVGELAVGNLPNRAVTLAGLRAIPRLTELRSDAVYDFVERHNLYGLGLSWGDVQILSSAVVSGIPLWTTDKRLSKAAAGFGILWTP